MRLDFVPGRWIHSLVGASPRRLIRDHWHRDSSSAHRRPAAIPEPVLRSDILRMASGLSSVSNDVGKLVSAAGETAHPVKATSTALRLE